MTLKEEKKYYEESFKAKEYLKEYFAKCDISTVQKYVLQKLVATENVRIMMHLAEVGVPEIKSIFEGRFTVLLELGGGPTLYQLFNVAEVVSEVHFTDYVEDNLREIRRWLKKERGAFNWLLYAKVALMLKKDSPNVSEREVKKLENLLRRKITKVSKCDVFKENLGIRRKSYDIISTHFVAEGATSLKSAWRRAIKNICTKISPRGLLIMSVILGARGSYRVLKKRFPVVELYENDLYRELKKNGFWKVKISPMITENPRSDYKGFMFVTAEKKQ